MRSRGVLTGALIAVGMAACGHSDGNEKGQTQEDAGPDMTDASGDASCASRPNAYAYRDALGNEALDCKYGCFEGFADCDAKPDNGCEVALGAEACAECGVAACVSPELCGTTASCDAGPAREGWLTSMDPANEISSLSALADGGLVFSGPQVAERQDPSLSRQLSLVRGQVVGLDPEGNVLWHASGTDGGSAQVTVSHERIYVYSPDATEGLVQAVSLDGTLLWSGQLPSTAQVSIDGVVSDAQHNVYATMIVLDGELEIGTDSFSRFAVVSWDAEGQLRWANGDFASVVNNRSLTVSSAGNVMIAWANQLLELAGADGKELPARATPGEAAARTRIAAGEDGSTYFAFESRGDAVISASLVPKEFSGRSFPLERETLVVAKYDANGKPIWTRPLAFAFELEDGLRVSPGIIDFERAADGRLFLVGMIYSDGSSPFLVVLSPDGEIVATDPMDGTALDVTDLSLDEQGNAYLTGRYEALGWKGRQLKDPATFLMQRTY